MIDEKEINIFTDGSQYSGPRQGGVGILIVTVDEDGNDKPEEVILPGYVGASNNQMELQAPVLALKEVLKRYDLEKYKKIIITSDSTYFVNNYQNAIYNWPKANWRNRDGRPILNVPIWEEFSKLYKKIRSSGFYIEIKWKKGKSSEYTKQVDRLAKKSAKNPLNKSLLVQSVRKKRFPGETEPGKVRMNGQRMQVAILSMEPMGGARGYRHRYQVLSKESPYYKVIDFIYTDSPIVRDGHCYNVRVNSDNSYPKILKRFSEFDFKTRKIMTED